MSPGLTVYDNFSFDFSSHKMPLMYNAYGNAVELNHKVKLNSDVKNKGGAYVLDLPLTFYEFEVEFEFLFNNDVDTARGFEIVLTKNKFKEEDFADSYRGYRTDYDGIGFFLYRSVVTKKWHLMTL